MGSQASAPSKLQVIIVYNGAPHSFEYVPQQSINSVRQQALNFFGIRGDGRERARLFAPDNQSELPDNASMESHVEPGTTLILRPVTSGGGAR